MKLIVGLGNPGPDYSKTRHNVGFMVIDRLVDHHDLGAGRHQFHGQSFQGMLADQKVLLIKPMQYMNRSGGSVRDAINFYKLDLQDLLVVVDDTALPCGVIRARPSGSSGGHNGLADIEANLDSRQFARLRIGIDPSGRIPQADYVLGRFSAGQTKLIEPAVEFACQAIEFWIKNSIEEVMNRFNATDS